MPVRVVQLSAKLEDMGGTAIQLRPEQILADCVSPGMTILVQVATEASQPVDSGASPQQVATVQSSAPMKPSNRNTDNRLSPADSDQVTRILTLTLSSVLTAMLADV